MTAPESGELAMLRALRAVAAGRGVPRSVIAALLEQQRRGGRPDDGLGPDQRPGAIRVLQQCEVLARQSGGVLARELLGQLIDRQLRAEGGRRRSFGLVPLPSIHDGDRRDG